MMTIVDDEAYLLKLAEKYVAEGSVRDLAMGLRKAHAISAAAAIYLEEKIRIETEQAIAEVETANLADSLAAPEVDAALDAGRLDAT